MKLKLYAYSFLAGAFALMMASCRSATKLYEKGRYDEAVEVAAKKLQKDPKDAKLQDVYVQKAFGTNKTAFNIAVADWFNEPQVLELDLSQWTKQADQTIRVQAQDDTYVAKVHMVIRGPNNSLLEEGDAVRSDGLWWTYTTRMTVTQEGTFTVTAQAFDLAGNKAELALGK